MNLDLYIITEYKPKHSRFAITVSDDKTVLSSLKFDANKINGVNKFAVVSLITSLGVALQLI